MAGQHAPSAGRFLLVLLLCLSLAPVGLAATARDGVSLSHDGDRSQLLVPVTSRSAPGWVAGNAARLLQPFVTASGSSRDVVRGQARAMRHLLPSSPTHPDGACDADRAHSATVVFAAVTAGRSCGSERDPTSRRGTYSSGRSPPRA